VRLILASTSPYRKTMLSKAGLDFETMAPRVDEAAFKVSRPTLSGAELASALATAKALEVSARHPDAMVIGADQVLDGEGRLFDKPKDRAEARLHLQKLRAKRHRLISAVALARGAQLIWQDALVAELVMRNFSDDFLDVYLERMGEAATRTVGAYEIEGLGAQLFERVEGDLFTIMGLPLLPLLAALRREGAIRS